MQTFPNYFNSSFTNSLTINYETNSKLESAKQLEHDRPDEALKIYLLIAEKGNTEAQYRCGSILLEGRGTKRNFNAAISYLSMAAHKGHAEAKQSIDRIKNRYEKLCSIVVEFDKLNRKDDINRNEMPVKLQRALVDLIKADRKESPQERFTIITISEIMTAFSDLITIVSDPDCPPMRALKEYQMQNIATLLTKGIEQYDQEICKKK